jgi:hypothetical protein
MRKLQVAGLILAMAGAVPAYAAQTPVPAANAAPLDMAAVHQYLVGTWQNDDDTRRSLELDADGRAYDRLVGEERDSEPGRWSIFLGAAAPARLAGVKFDPKVVYLEIDRDDDVLLYAVLQVSRSEMRMLYLQQNRQVLYSRLK